jgi:hypothetical protein
VSYDARDAVPESGDPRGDRRQRSSPFLAVVIGGADDKGDDDTVSAGNGAQQRRQRSSATSRPPSAARSAARPPLKVTTRRPPFTGWSDPFLVGKPYGDKVDGLITFRGNLTRTYYGKARCPTAPAVQWRFPPSGGLCSPSIDQSGEQIWCGTGWTGQPSVFERGGQTWVVFGAYDRRRALPRRHQRAAAAARLSRPVTSSRVGDDRRRRVSARLHRIARQLSSAYSPSIATRPVELFKLSAFAVKPTLWNDDWDGSPLMIGDYLLEGGENSQFHVLKLNRGYGADGKVTVDPQLVFNAPGWDAELLAAVHDNDVSIENSVAVYGNTVYFSNSGGLVQGWDLTPLRSGGAPQRVFRYWTGDDTDASIVIDEAGMLYIGVEYERLNDRSRAVGQIVKLDPSRADPLVWKRDERPYNNAGVWATPALYRDIVIYATDEGKVLGLDRRRARCDGRSCCRDRRGSHR